MPENKNLLTSTQVLVGVVTALITAIVALVGALVQIGLLHPRAAGPATPQAAAPTRLPGDRPSRRPAPSNATGGAAPGTPAPVAVAPAPSVSAPSPAPAGSPTAPAASPTPSGSVAATGTATAGARTVTLLAPDALAAPLGSLDQSLQHQTPSWSIQAHFGSSPAPGGGQAADVLAVADPRTLPTGAGGWYVGFASDAIVVAYTDASKDTASITPENWYQILAEPGARVGRLDPDADPLGYQALLSLQLAEQYYQQPGLTGRILANAPQANLRPTEAALVSALQAGQVDYILTYRSNAVQQHLKSVSLPAEVNLGDLSKADRYRTVSVQTANGTQTGAPIVYAATVPSTAVHADAGVGYLQALLGPTGQLALKQDGLSLVTPPLAAGGSAVPAALSQMTAPWPQS